MSRKHMPITEISSVYISKLDNNKNNTSRNIISALISMTIVLVIVGLLG